MVSFPQVSPPEPCTPLSPATLAPHAPAHLILLDCTTRTIFGKEYRSLSSSLCNFRRFCYKLIPNRRNHASRIAHSRLRGSWRPKAFSFTEALNRLTKSDFFMNFHASFCAEDWFVSVRNCGFFRHRKTRSFGKFDILLIVHPGMIHGKWPTWRTILFYVFISILYTFRAPVPVAERSKA